MTANDVGSVQSITFGDVIIWHSENDDRVVIDEVTETYEPWKAYLTTKLEVYVDYLQSVVKLL